MAAPRPTIVVSSIWPTLIGIPPVLSGPFLLMLHAALPYAHYATGVSQKATVEPIKKSCSSRVCAVPTYIAMLRGINVGGRKIIKMEYLRLSFEALGCRGVRTYVQSGNVVFETAKASSTGLSKSIGEQILHDFGFAVSFILKTPNEMKKVVGTNPFLKKRAIDQSKLYVTFLSSPPAPTALQNLNALDTEPDQFCITGREIYLYCPNGYGRTKLSNNAFERMLSVKATTRNWKTVNMLLEMSSKSA
jgi:uncharacterized protein (DUF1697 family)